MAANMSFPFLRRIFRTPTNTCRDGTCQIERQRPKPPVNRLQPETNPELVTPLRTTAPNNRVVALDTPDTGAVNVRNPVEVAAAPRVWTVGQTTLHLDQQGRPVRIELDPAEGKAFTVDAVEYRGSSRVIDQVTIVKHENGKAVHTVYRRLGQGARWSRERDGQRMGLWYGDIAVNTDNEYAFRTGNQRDAHGTYQWRVYDLESAEGLSVLQDPNGASRTKSTDGSWVYSANRDTEEKTVGRGTLHLDGEGRPTAIELDPEGGDDVLITGIGYRGDSRIIDRVTIVDAEGGDEIRTTYERVGHSSRWRRIVNGQRQRDWYGQMAVREDGTFGYRTGNQRDKDGAHRWQVLDLESGETQLLLAYKDGHTRTQRPDGSWLFRRQDGSQGEYDAEGELLSLNRADGSTLRVQRDASGDPTRIDNTSGGATVTWVPEGGQWVARDGDGHLIASYEPSARVPVGRDLTYRYFDNDGTRHVTDSAGVERTLRASKDLETAKENLRVAFVTRLEAEGVRAAERERRLARLETFAAEQFEVRERRLARLHQQQGHASEDGIEHMERAQIRVKNTLDEMIRLLNAEGQTVFERRAGEDGVAVSRTELVEQALAHYAAITNVDQSWNACQMATAERACMWHAPDALAKQAVNAILTGSFTTVDGHTVTMPFRDTMYPRQNERRFNLDVRSSLRSPWSQIVQHMLGNAYNRANGSRSVYYSQHGWVSSETREASRLVTGYSMRYRADYGNDWKAALRNGELLGTTGHAHAWAYVPVLEESPDGRVYVRTYVDDNSYGEWQDRRYRL